MGMLLGLSVFMFSPGFSDAATETLADALAAHVGQSDQPEDFRLITECRTQGRARTVRIDADRTAIWGGRAQFVLSTEEISEILDLLHRYEFAHMPDIFGGAVPPEEKDERPTVIRDDDPSARVTPRSGAPDLEEEIPAAVIVTCRVVLALDGFEKQVFQRSRGQQSEEFRQMAAAILDICEGPAEKGISIDSLGDGLEKLAANKLTASMLTLLVHHKVAEPSERSGYGWLLRIEEGRATARTYDVKGALGEAIALELDNQAMAGILDLLSRNEVGSLPVNIQARDYTELVVEILNQRLGVQARRFAQDAGHPESMKEFENVVAGLERVYREVLDKGV